ncbi:MAG: DNA polymerase IV [Tepidisphaera sp.]|nr:DNA polymerase IV [Tepidisphaera sp.]
MPLPRTILHVDMDAFFASVEQRDNPELRGKPVIVGGGWGGEHQRGVVTAASYEARKFGVRAAMPGMQARRLCPQGIFVRGRFDVYAQVSRQLRAILHTFTPDIQMVSIDEAFIDATGVMHAHASGLALGQAIKIAVKRELHLNCTVGVSENKFLAKLASDLYKPDGLGELREADAPQRLATMPVTVLMGVGPKAAASLAQRGLRTVADLRAWLDARDDAQVTREMGEHALGWRRQCVGQDDRPVRERDEAKSIGKERTFGEDVAAPEVLRATVLGQVEETTRRLRAAGLKCRGVTLKLRTPDFRTFSRSTMLDAPTDETGAVWAAAEGVLTAWLAAHPGPLRLIGVALHDLTATGQMELFGSDQKPNKVDAAADAIAAKFGKGSITRAGAIAKRTEA